MSRFRRQKAYEQHIRKLYDGCYEISWAVDYYYPDSRLRHPRGFRRITDTKGANRFAKKHNLKAPNA